MEKWRHERQERWREKQIHETEEEQKRKRGAEKKARQRARDGHKSKTEERATQGANDLNTHFVAMWFMSALMLAPALPMIAGC